MTIETIDILAQSSASVLSGIGFVLIQFNNRTRRTIGTVCGALAQPSWWFTTVFHGQWFLIPVMILYVVGWGWTWHKNIGFSLRHDNPRLS